MSSAENGKPAGRLVWITEANREWLIYHCGREVADYVIPWNAAPADPAEAVRLAIGHGIRDGLNSTHITPGVLQALGVPSPSPTRSENP